MLRLTLVALQLHCLAVAGEPLKQRLPFYHSSDEFHSLLEEAVNGCKTADARLEERMKRSITLDVVTISKAGGGPSKPKAVFVFGEHARELVSSESGLHFVQSLCGMGSASSETVQKALAQMDFVIIPNANPQGRSLVESGSFCKRTNENGVDLNRNWGNDHRDVTTMRLASADARAGADDDDAGDASEENPGATGFSEPESEIVREVVEQSSPKLFLSVHSGAYLLGLPYGFSAQASPPNAGIMNQILSSISTKYCRDQCPYGNLARTIGYISAGCSVDYVSERMNVPFAFTWEIYGDAKTTARAAADAQANTDVKQNKMSAWTAMASTFNQGGAKEEVQAQENSTDGGYGIPMSKAKQSAQNDADCLARFNPQDEATLSGVLGTWSEAYMDLAEQAATAQVQKASPSQSQQSQTIRDHDSPSAHAEGAQEWMEMMKTKNDISNSKLAAIEPDQSEEKRIEDLDKFESGVPSWNAMSSTNQWGFLNARVDLPPSVASDPQ